MDSLVDWMKDSDLDAVAALHGTSFDDPWSVPMIHKILAMQGAAGIVLRSRSHILTGFALVRVCLDECELLSLAIAPDHREQGLGARILDHVISLAVEAGAEHLFLEVGEQNEAARALYARRGMEQVGRRERYYRLNTGDHMDALTLRYDLRTHVGHLSAVSPSVRSRH